MNRIRRVRRVAAALGAMALTWLGLAAAAPAAFAKQLPKPGDGGPSSPGPLGVSPLVPRAGEYQPGFGGTVTRTVVVGGMPGWQIALIAVAAALVAASLAVLAYRARSAHRISIPTAA